MNLLNKDQTIGMTNVDIKLFEYDVAEDKLKVDENGKYIEVKDDSGLALIKIGPNAIYNGNVIKLAKRKLREMLRRMAIVGLILEIY